MTTARKTIASVHKTLKPLVESYQIEKGEKFPSTKTIRGWSGGDLSAGYRMTIDKWNKIVKLEYNTRGYTRPIEKYIKIVDALRTVGLIFKIKNYYPYRDVMIIEKPQVTDFQDYLEISYED